MSWLSTEHLNVKLNLEEENIFPIFHSILQHSYGASSPSPTWVSSLKFKFKFESMQCTWTSEEWLSTFVIHTYIQHTQVNSGTSSCPHKQFLSLLVSTWNLFKQVSLKSSWRGIFFFNATSGCWVKELNYIFSLYFSALAWVCQRTQHPTEPKAANGSERGSRLVSWKWKWTRKYHLKGATSLLLNS